MHHYYPVPFTETDDYIEMEISFASKIGFLEPERGFWRIPKDYLDKRIRWAVLRALRPGIEWNEDSDSSTFIDQIEAKLQRHFNRELKSFSWLMSHGSKSKRNECWNMLITHFVGATLRSQMLLEEARIAGLIEELTDVTPIPTPEQWEVVIRKIENGEHRSECFGEDAEPEPTPETEQEEEA
ncbi:MAG: hypothetical protein IJF84_13525 [Thermoguttaceae bacterium]|nr:hypothetical protein [Thermoguttaceae bacterium]